MILQQKLDSIMERDIHGENGRYFIRSQYYDSIDDQDLWDNHGMECMKKGRFV